MCRVATVGVALALGALSCASALPAQAPGRDAIDARVLLARAESLQHLVDLRDSAVRRAAYRQRLARRFSAGDVTVLLAGAPDASAGERVAARAAELLDGLGAVPRAFVASRVTISTAAEGADSVIRAEGLTGRARVNADLGLAPDTLSGPFIVGIALARAYRETLDTAWRSWAPADLALGWIEAREGVAARRDLMGGAVRSGALCLAGEAAQCRLWLGLDRDAHPFRARYQPGDLRRLISARWWEGEPGREIARECVGGSDEACVRFAESGRFLDSIPAGMQARGSLLRAVHRLHGAAAVARALADTSGSIGERLARAAGVGEDSLVAEWRAWLLTSGAGRHVTADLADGLPVAIFGALLLVAALRSGRWR